MSDDEFDALADRDAFLEWAEIHGHRYGTLEQAVAAARSGGDVVLEIDVQGARSVRERAPDAVLVFLVPPSTAELARRLARRGTESERERAARLAKGEAEMAEAEWFHHVVVNDDVDRAAREVAAILEGPSPKESQ